MTCDQHMASLEALATFIQAKIPELSGHVCVGQAPASEDEEIPNLSIDVGKWKYEPEELSEHAVMPGNVAIYEVGEFTAGVVLSIVAGTPGERRTLGAKVLELFLSARHPLNGIATPGFLSFEITACPELSKWSCSFDLDDDEWIDTAALDRRYESRITATCAHPALTRRTPVYTIETLVLETQQIPPTTTTPVAPASLVTIDINGHIEPFTP